MKIHEIMKQCCPSKGKWFTRLDAPCWQSRNSNHRSSNFVWPDTSPRVQHISPPDCWDFSKLQDVSRCFKALKVAPKVWENQWLRRFLSRHPIFSCHTRTWMPLLSGLCECLWCVWLPKNPWNAPTAATWRSRLAVVYLLMGLFHGMVVNWQLIVSYDIATILLRTCQTCWIIPW